MKEEYYRDIFGGTKYGDYMVYSLDKSESKYSDYADLINQLGTYYNTTTFTKVGGGDTPWSWNSEDHELKTISCIFLQLLNDRLRKKMDKLSDGSIPHENVDKLSDFVNSELTSIKRETVLKSLLNE